MTDLEEIPLPRKVRKFVKDFDFGVSKRKLQSFSFRLKGIVTLLLLILSPTLFAAPIPKEIAHPTLNGEYQVSWGGTPYVYNFDGPYHSFTARYDMPNSRVSYAGKFEQPNKDTIVLTEMCTHHPHTRAFVWELKRDGDIWRLSADGKVVTIRKILEK